MNNFFRGSILVTLLGSVCALFIGFFYTKTIGGALNALFITLMLAVLEISLSFDNAIVNAAILRHMTPLWQRRFLTWGIFIAVFVMRLVFPLALVSVTASINPVDAVILAATKPDEYARIMIAAHTGIAGFGGAFLLMVSLKYFFDKNKNIHWISLIEKPLVVLGKMDTVEIGMALIIVYLASRCQTSFTHQFELLVSGISGIIVFIFVDGISSLLKAPDQTTHVDLNRASIGMFLYLEVLDASFSFDGVVGAFAVTSNLFIIMVGLGIGAMFVRSLTVMFVKKGTLAAYKYLEHGAYYAIAALAIIMFAGTLVHVPEVVSGLLGAMLIAGSLVASIRKRY